jgi:hypothetical protein
MIPAVRELENLAQMAVAPNMEATAHEVLATLRLEPSVMVEANDLRLMRRSKADWETSPWIFLHLSLLATRFSHWIRLRQLSV